MDTYSQWIRRWDLSTTGSNYLPSSIPTASKFKVTWTGKLRVLQSGQYQFGDQACDDEISISIDGNPPITFTLLSNTSSWHSDNSKLVTLMEGMHDISITYSNSGGGYANFIMGWKKPGSSEYSSDFDDHFYHVENTGSGYSFSGDYVSGNASAGYLFNAQSAQDGQYPVTYTQGSCETPGTVVVAPSPLNTAIFPTVQLTGPADAYKVEDFSATPLTWQVNTSQLPVSCSQGCSTQVQLIPALFTAEGDLFPDYDHATTYSMTGVVSQVNFNQAFPSVSLTNVPQPFFWRVGVAYSPSEVAWSGTQSLLMPEGDRPVDAYLTSAGGPSQKINWFYEITYPDPVANTQNIENMVFLDGLGQVRQEQMKLNSNAAASHILCSEKVYSEEGGGAVQSMTAPTGSDQFAYDVDFFDVSEDNVQVDFATRHFDREVLNGTLGTSTSFYSPMEPTKVIASSSLGHYYSNTNTNEPYVDDAKGYPYAYSLGYKDPRGLEEFGSGVGNTFRMTGGREIQSFYVSPGEKELIRLYGKKRVQEDKALQNISKTVVQDPNGVVTIHYLDDEGKTIATGMTSCNVENLQALDEPGSALGFTNLYNAIKNNVTYEGRLAMESSVSFYVPCTVNKIKLDYNLDVARLMTGNTTCTSCRYDLEVRLVETTTGLTIPIVNQNIFKQEIPSTAETNPSCTGVAHQNPFASTEVTLPRPGSYTLYRTLKPWTDKITGQTLLEKTISEYSAYLNNPANQADLLSEFNAQYKSKTNWYVLRKGQKIDDKDRLPNVEQCDYITTTAELEEGRAVSIMTVMEDGGVYYFDLSNGKKELYYRNPYGAENLITDGLGSTATDFGTAITASSAQLVNPIRIKSDPQGNVFILDDTKLLYLNPPGVNGATVYKLKSLTKTTEPLIAFDTDVSGDLYLVLLGQSGVYATSFAKSSGSLGRNTTDNSLLFTQSYPISDMYTATTETYRDLQKVSSNLFMYSNISYSNNSFNVNYDAYTFGCSTYKFNGQGIGGRVFIKQIFDATGAAPAISMDTDLQGVYLWNFGSCNSSSTLGVEMSIASHSFSTGIQDGDFATAQTSSISAVSVTYGGVRYIADTYDGVTRLRKIWQHPCNEIMDPNMADPCVNKPAYATIDVSWNGHSKARTNGVQVIGTDLSVSIPKELFVPSLPIQGLNVTYTKAEEIRNTKAVVDAINNSSSGFTASWQQGYRDDVYRITVKAPQSAGAYYNYSLSNYKPNSVAIVGVEGQDDQITPTALNHGYTAPANCAGTSPVREDWLDQVSIVSERVCVSETCSTSYSSGVVAMAYSYLKPIQMGENFRSETDLVFRQQAIQSTLNASSLAASQNGILRLYGRLKVEAASRFELQALAAGGIRVYLNGQLAIDYWINAPTNATTARYSGTFELDPGYYPLVVEYFCPSLSPNFTLNWNNTNDHTFGPIDASALYHTPYDVPVLKLKDLDGIMLGTADGNMAEQYTMNWNTNGQLTLQGTTSPEMTAFQTAYANQRWKPTEEVVSTQKATLNFQLNAYALGKMPVMDEKSRIVEPLQADDFQLFLATVNPDGCGNMCYVKTVAMDCSTSCNNMLQAGVVDALELKREINTYPNTYSIGGTTYTLSQIADAHPNGLQSGNLNDALFLTNMVDLELAGRYQPAGTDLIESWSRAKSLVTTLNVASCIDQCEHPDKALCPNCQTSYDNAVRSKLEEVANGYQYFLDKWEALSDHNAFPYTYNSTTKAYNLTPDDRDNLGELLYTFIAQDLAATTPVFSLKNLSEWQALPKGTLSSTKTLSSPGYSGISSQDGSYTFDCPSAAPLTNELGQIPNVLLDVLADDVLITNALEYKKCIEDVKQSFSDTRCQEWQAKCQSLHPGNSACTSCTQAEDDARESLIRKSIQNVYGNDRVKTADALAQLKSGTSATPGTDLKPTCSFFRKVTSPNLGHYTVTSCPVPALHLDDLSDQLALWEEYEKCKLECGSKQTKEYQTFLDEKLRNFTVSIRQNFLDNCFGKTAESMSVSFPENYTHYTLYEYDATGRLLSTTPPEGVDYIPDATPEITRTPTHRMQSTYAYNSLNELKNSQSPDGGKTKYLYDKAGRLRFSQNEEQKARYALSPLTAYFEVEEDPCMYTVLGMCVPGMAFVPHEEPNPKGEVFSFTDYDPETGRISQTGEMKVATNTTNFIDFGFDESQTDRQIFLSSYVDDQSTTTTLFANNTSSFGYVSLVTDVSTFTYDVPTLSYGTLTQDHLRNRLSSVCNKDACSYFSYDVYGRVKQVVQELKVYTNEYVYFSKFITLNYEYNPLSGLVTQVIYQKGNGKEEFRHRYGYDADHRLQTVETSADYGQHWKTVGRYGYYAHGPLKRSELGGNVQGLDYVYNLQGWLKAINHPLEDKDPGADAVAAGPHAGFAPDVFGHLLNYFAGDFNRTGKALDATAPIVPTNAIVNDNTTKNYRGRSLFNGNISSTVSRNPFYENGQSEAGGDLMAQRYAYDHLNRLVESHTERKTSTTSGSFSPWGTQPSATASPFSEKLSYDPNGNIKSLVRYGASTASPLDNLNYSYFDATNTAKEGLTYGLDPNDGTKRTLTNRLQRVANPGANTANGSLVENQENPENYGYDRKGRLTRDLVSNQKYAWTAHDKLASVTPDIPNGTDPSLYYTYDPMGRRICKRVDYPDGTANDHTDWYAYDASGNLMATYRQQADNSLRVQEYYLYGSGRLGSYAAPAAALPMPEIPGTAPYAALTFEGSSTEPITGSEWVDIASHTVRYLPASNVLNGTVTLNGMNSTFVMEGTLGPDARVVLSGLNNTVVIKGTVSGGSISGFGSLNKIVVLGSLETGLTLGMQGGLGNSVLIGPNGGWDCPDGYLPTGWALDNTGGASFVTLNVEGGKVNNNGQLTALHLYGNGGALNNAGVLDAPQGVDAANGFVLGNGGTMRTGDVTERDGGSVVNTGTWLAADGSLLDGTLSGTEANPSALGAGGGAVEDARRYHFELSDHLGNVRAVVGGGKNTDGTADVLSLKDYYPFGAEMGNRTLSPTGYRYSFNGKETDKETGVQDYGFRMYSQELGRFMSADPIANKFPMLSSYQFASNTPIQAIDLDGLEAYFIHGTWATPTTFPAVTIAISKEIFGNIQSFSFGWTGYNSDVARKIAAVNLAAEIAKNYNSNSNTREPLTLIGHSHGGNVTIMAANILQDKYGIKVDNILTINTPVREYQLNDNSDTKHYHVYHENDPVQLNGGNDFLIPDKMRVKGYEPGVGPIWETVYEGGTDKIAGESGSAGAEFKRAINLKVPGWQGGPLNFKNFHNSHTKPYLWAPKLSKIVNGKQRTIKMPKPKPTQADATRTSGGPKHR